MQYVIMFYLVSAVICAVLLLWRYDSVKQKALAKLSVAYPEETNLDHSTMFLINTFYIIFMPVINTKFAYHWLGGLWVGLIMGWNEKDE